MSAMSSNVENLSPQIIRGVVKELTELIEHPPEGLRVILNDEDVTDIQAKIDGPAGTPYAGGVFRVKLALGKDFPQSPPKAFFLTKIFHPNVAKSGEICVNTLKKDWKPDLGIKHILLTVKCLLIVPNAESALNEDAGKLLLERYDDYARRARMMTEVHAQIYLHPLVPHTRYKDGSKLLPKIEHQMREHVDIYGMVKNVKPGLETSCSSSEGPSAKKHAGAKPSSDKLKLIKDKKRTLKRL